MNSFHYPSLKQGAQDLKLFSCMNMYENRTLYLCQAATDAAQPPTWQIHDDLAAGAPVCAIALNGNLYLPLRVNSD